MTARRAIPLALVALVLAACAGAAAPASGTPEIQRTLDAAGGGAFQLGLPGQAPGTDPGAAEGKPADEDGGAVQQVFDPDRKLILTASVAMRADDPWAISDRVLAIAAGLGGEVVGLSQQGSGEERSAMLTVRVPSERFQEALREIRGIAEVEVLSSSVDSQDVTDQFVDLEARLRAKQAEEERYLALLTRAERIEDILRIDQVLAQVRTEIERLTAQIRSIESRAEFSTISVHVATAVGLPPKPGAWDPARTVEQALTALVSVLRVAVDAAIWALVFGWLPLLFLALAALATRAVRRTGIMP